MLGYLEGNARRHARSLCGLNVARAHFFSSFFKSSVLYVSNTLRHTMRRYRAYLAVSKATHTSSSVALGVCLSVSLVASERLENLVPRVLVVRTKPRRMCALRHDTIVHFLQGVGPLARRRVFCVHEMHLERPLGQAGGRGKRRRLACGLRSRGRWNGVEQNFLRSRISNYGALGVI